MALTRFVAAYAFAAALWAADEASEANQILTKNCGGCHSAAVKLSGLDLSTREALLKGGNKGAAIDLAAPEKSLLLQAVHRRPGIAAMPPTKALAAEEVALLERWVKAGAPWVEGSKPQTVSWWSFQPPKRPEVPATFEGKAAQSREACLARGFDPSSLL
jgi:cytochrome c551/c552